MWKKKNEHDQLTGAQLPIPTQLVSNEEYFPTPQTPEQRKVEMLLREWSAERSQTLGLSPAQVSRRKLRDGDGLYGHERSVRPVVQGERRRRPSILRPIWELWPKNSFVFGVQTQVGNRAASI